MSPIPDNDSRNNLVKYRIDRCRETLREVDYLINGNFYNAALSRLYYACYYAVVALLIANGIETHSHAGVKSIFSLHFIKTQLIDKEIAKTFFQLFDLRHNNDYDDFSFCEKETIEQLRPLAEEFINSVISIIPSPPQNLNP